MHDKTIRRAQTRFLQEDKNDEDDAILQLLGTYKGRRLLWWLLTQCQTFGDTFTGNALTTSYNAGQQSIGKSMFARIMELNPEAYIQMTKEASATDKERVKVISKLGQKGDYDETE